MIHLIGIEGTSEYSAAEDLRSLILKASPPLLHDTTCDIWIVSSAKCHGQRVRDIDILLLASFRRDLEYDCFLPFVTDDGRLHSPSTIHVNSLCLVIEVKDHPPEDVRFIGTRAEVRYRQAWHDASEQNESQKYAVKGYLEVQGLRAPWITSFLWLRNVPATSLPRRPHSILGSAVTWELIMNVVSQLSPPKFEEGQWTLDAFAANPADLHKMVDLFTKVLVPTRLDRRRMERITQRSMDLVSIEQTLGQKLTILRGRGGTGKTVHLLQAAHDLFEREGARVLILTYNKALVADVRRLLTILGVSDQTTGRAIQIQTVHSFLRSALRGLGIVPADSTDFLEDYERMKDEALSFLVAGAISPSDIEQLAASDFETFRWDYVFVDEGQDWPRNERDLLLSLYPYSRVMVADGVDQLIRSVMPINWRGDLKRSQVNHIHLTTSLRMKAGLARFVSSIARNLGLPYSEWNANEDLPGGRVVIVNGPYFRDRGLHDRLMSTNAADGNSPIDMLFCVPPSLVAHPPAGGPARSLAAATFEQWGFKVWDGASEDVRESYPTEIDQLRVVQYESCRGLEGWISVNLGLDRLFELKLSKATTELSTESDSTGNGIDAHLSAARWLLIPLTRAMDTLVIQLDREYSVVRTAVEAAAAEYPESVEWISLR